MCILVTIMSAMPQKNSNVLFDKIHYYVESQDEPSEFDLRRLWSEAEKLSNADVAAASIVKAAICVFRRQKDEVYYWNNNAIKNNNSTATLLNAAVNLRLFGDFGEAANLAMRAMEIAPQDVQVVMLGGEALALAGRLSDGIKAFEALGQITDEVQDDLQHLKSRLHDLEIAGVTELQLQREVTLANEVAMDNKIRIARVDTQTCEFSNDPPQVFVSMRFKGDVNNELDLEEKLAVRLSELENWDPLKLNVEFKYISPNELLKSGLTASC